MSASDEEFLDDDFDDYNSEIDEEMEEWGEEYLNEEYPDDIYKGEEESFTEEDLDYSDDLDYEDFED